MRRALQATTGTVLLSPAIKALKTRETLDETTLTAIAATTMTSRSEWNTRHAVSYRQGNWPRDPRDVESSSSSYERQTCYELTEQHGTSASRRHWPPSGPPPPPTAPDLLSQGILTVLLRHFFMRKMILNFSLYETSTVRYTYIGRGDDFLRDVFWRIVITFEPRRLRHRNRNQSKRINETHPGM